MYQITQTVDVSTARKNFSKLIDQVYLQDKSVMITKWNIPVAQIVKPGKKVTGLSDKGEDAYGWMDDLVGAVKTPGKKVTYGSQKVDDIYYNK